MKSFLPLLSLAFLTSCTSAYKSGQTPDDVYYSPGRPQANSEEYVRQERRDDGAYRYEDRRQDAYNEDYYYDRYLRMKIRNRSRWSSIDADWYSYNPYAFNNQYYYSYNSPWSHQYYWNHYYNPYAPVVIFNPATRVYRSPRTSNLQVFNNPNVPSGTQKPSPRSRSLGTPRNSDYNQRESDVGRSLRDVFRNSNSNSSSNQPSTRPSVGSRDNSGSSTPSSSGSSSRGSGGSAPVRRF